MIEVADTTFMGPMSHPNKPTKWATVEWPQQSRVTPSQLESMCGWRVRANGSSWTVAAEERYYEGRTPRLISIVDRLDPGATPSDSTVARVNGWKRGHTTPPEALAKVSAEVDRLQKVGTPAAIAESVQGMFTALDGVDFDDLVRRLPADDPVRTWLVVEMDTRVHARMSVIRMLFAVQHAPHTLDQRRKFGGFESMRSLTGDYYGLYAMNRG